jgi:D-3-phosphoglycerate dehydrogenase
MFYVFKIEEFIVAQPSTNQLHIVVMDDYQNAIRNLNAFDKLKDHRVTVLTEIEKDVDALAEKLKDADVIVPVRERSVIDKGLLTKLPKLKLISQSGKGCAHIDVAACTRLGIAVAASSGNSYAPAELTWTLILASMRNLPAEVASANAGKWQTQMIGTQLRGRTLGIYGYGSIGAIVAGYAKAFGMRVLAWGREGSQERAKKDGLEVPASRKSFFEECDVISVHLRLSSDTRGIITSEDLASMKPTALFVNTSRADLVVPGALAAALDEGRPGFAAVDTYEQEPATEYPLFNNPRAICVPHLGYVEKDTYEIFFGGAFDNILAFQSGKAQNVVNPEALK